MKKLLLCLALVLPVVLVPQAAQAAPQDPKITPSKVYAQVLPCAGTGPSEFTVSGKGFGPHEEIELSVGGVDYDSFTADGMGRYAETARIKPLPSGTYPVLLIGEDGDVAATTIYIGWSGCRSTSDGELTIRGAGFAGKDEVQIILDGKIEEAVLTGPRGRFDVTYDCPSGKHTAKVIGAGGRTLNFGSFTC